MEKFCYTMHVTNYLFPLKSVSILKISYLIDFYLIPSVFVTMTVFTFYLPNPSISDQCLYHRNTILLVGACTSLCTTMLLNCASLLPASVLPKSMASTGSSSPPPSLHCTTSSTSIQPASIDEEVAVDDGEVTAKCSFFIFLGDGPPIDLAEPCYACYICAAIYCSVLLSVTVIGAL